MAWPGDPYGTGQQLYRRPSPRLAAFALARPAATGLTVPLAYAVVYLPVHRTRQLTITQGTLTFGFRAAAVGNPADAPAAAALADLDLLQARRHAVILAGHNLPDDLAVLRQAAGVPSLRGLAAAERAWQNRHTRGRGIAAVFDTMADLPGSPGLEQVCRRAGTAVPPSPGEGGPCGCEPGHFQDLSLLASSAVAQALVIALVCARHLGRYAWEEIVNPAQIMTANTWDCFPRAGQTAREAGHADASTAVRAPSGTGLTAPAGAATPAPGAHP